MQQLNAYQKLSELNCVVATYDHDNRSHVPFFSGAVATVYNYANVGVNGKPVGAPTGQFLCARARNYKRYTCIDDTGSQISEFPHLRTQFRNLHLLIR